MINSSSSSFQNIHDQSEFLLGALLRLLKDQQGPLERSFLAGINVSHIHVCADITDPLIQGKNDIFLLKPTDGSGSEARHAAAKVQTHISVYLTISEPRSMGHRDHYW